MDAIALYDFSSGSGDMVFDRAAAGDGLDLRITDPSKVVWEEGGLRIVEQARITSDVVATAMTARLLASNALSLEAWVTPELDATAGPDRIVTLTQDSDAINFLLGQGGGADDERAVWTARLRTPMTDNRGDPRLESPEGLAVAGKRTHVLFAHAEDGDERLYVDGVEVAAGGRPGRFAGEWGDDHRLVIGNDQVEPRPSTGSWLGRGCARNLRRHRRGCCRDSWGCRACPSTDNSPAKTSRCAEQASWCALRGRGGQPAAVLLASRGRFRDRSSATTCALRLHHPAPLPRRSAALQHRSS